MDTGNRTNLAVSQRMQSDPIKLFAGRMTLRKKKQKSLICHVQIPIKIVALG